MTNKATKVELTNSTGNPRRYTCADGTTILLGYVLTLSDPRTAALVSDDMDNAGYVPAGIAAMDKEANDGSTSITAWTDGVFEMIASGNIAVGAAVKSIGAGYVAAASALDVASGVIIGNALEAGSDEETINVRVKI
jgi:hypothetical protein